MQQLVSITSRGQVSIPARMRRELGLDKHHQAIIRQKQGHLTIEPVIDLLNRGGSLKSFTPNNKSTNEVNKLEKEAT